MQNAVPPFLLAWETCAARTGSTLSGQALEAARRSWFDTLAATAAGVGENCTRAALASCGVPGDALRPVEAALVLGAASHALDYDDVCMLATCHPSAPVVAALLALLPDATAQRPDLAWRDMLAAYLVGTEAMLRLGEWLGFRHYALGFHATGTLGAVGAAAAAAHLLRLPLREAQAALAIAASSASGLRANFGSDTKPLHVGFAAASGVRAANLARAGADASSDVWGPKGFAAAFDGGEAPPLRWQGSDEWAIVHPGFEHKRFPSCYLTHRLIAGLLAIRARRSADEASQPVDIAIEVAHDGLAALKHPQARTGLQAKFSGPYCAAAAWIDGGAALASFSDAAVQRPALQAQMQRVVLRERPPAGESLDSAPVHVTVRGATWSDRITVDWAPGSPADPMTRAQLERKWQDCVAHGGGRLDAALAPVLLDAPLDTPATRLLLPLRAALLSAIAH